jgi:hypothetical protein
METENMIWTSGNKKLKKREKNVLASFEDDETELTVWGKDMLLRRTGAARRDIAATGTTTYFILGIFFFFFGCDCYSEPSIAEEMK